MKNTMIVLASLAIVLVALHVLAPSFVARSYIGAARIGAGLASRQIEVNGQVFHYLEGGSGPAVVLVHGFGADADNWLRLAPLLTSRYRVIAPDLPGFGHSPAPADADYSVDRQAQRVADLLGALTSGNVHLAGNSMGGQIVAVLAARRPELVQSLALLDPLGVEAEGAVPPSITMQRLAQGRNLLLPANQAEFAELLKLMFHRQPWVPGVVRGFYADRWLSARPQLAKVFADISEKYVPLAPLLAKIEVPVLVLWGADDNILPAEGARVLGAGLAHSEVLIIPQCGHLPMLEKPRATADAYLAFLATTAPQG